MKKKHKNSKKYKKKYFNSKQLKKSKKILKKRKKKFRKKTKRTKKIRLNNIKKKIIHQKIKKVQNESLTLKLVKLQLSLKPQFNFKINFDLEKYI